MSNSHGMMKVDRRIRVRERTSDPQKLAVSEMELIQTNRIVDPDHKGHLNEHRKTTGKGAHAMLFIDLHGRLLHEQEAAQNEHQH